MARTNEFGQPVGVDLGGWKPPIFPAGGRLTGDHVELEPLDARRHGAGLLACFTAAPRSLWTYMAIGPFDTLDALSAAIDVMVGYPDWQPYAILVDGEALGFASYLRIDPAGGVVEIGSIVFSPPLQRATAATEALFLMIDHAFSLGYRRWEWKCDDLNAPSRSAAERLGFRYEGTFRQATHYKGRNRDTAWYAITDAEWRVLRPAFLAWLSPRNFDRGGRQLTALQDHM